MAYVILIIGTARGRDRESRKMKHRKGAATSGIRVHIPRLTSFTSGQRLTSTRPFRISHCFFDNRSDREWKFGVDEDIGDDEVGGGGVDIDIGRL